jgi:hypothetical protein
VNGIAPARRACPQRVGDVPVDGTRLPRITSDGPAADHAATTPSEERAMRTTVHDDRPLRMIRLLALIGVVAVLIACGSSASAPMGQGAAGAAPIGAAAPAATAAPASSGSVFGGSQTGTTGDQVAQVDDAKIVRTGSLQLTVVDVAKAILAGRDTVRGLGGYIGASQQEGTKEHLVASVTYRIPVARWEEALDAIRQLGTEVGEQTEAVEVTGQLIDLDARIRNLKASEAALVGYAEKAPKISDLLEIEARLTETRGQIEQLSAQQAGLSDKAAMATLTVTYGTEVVAVTQAAQRWDPGAEVDRATATLLGIGQALASLAIVFAIVWLPVLLALSLIGVIAVVAARRLGWRRPVVSPNVPPTAAPEG